MKMRYRKKAAAGLTALVMAMSLAACDTDENPDGTNGETDNTNIATTTLAPGTTQGGDDMATTTLP